MMDKVGIGQSLGTLSGGTLSGPEIGEICAERISDIQAIKQIERLIISLVCETKHYTAIDHLTSALAHIRKCESCIEKFGVNFYKSV